MELPLGDKALLERSIEGMYNVCSRIIVVGGYRIERVREMLLGYSKVEVVENKNWQSGMFGSVKVGVRSIRSEKFFLLPADVPLVPERVYLKLLLVQANVVVPVFAQQRGHPILLNRAVIQAILDEPDTSSLRQVIARVGSSSVECSAEQVLMDIDTQDDYRAALEPRAHARSVQHK
jgi:molybdenum cofactor cytidylyltransferase